MLHQKRLLSLVLSNNYLVEKEVALYANKILVVHLNKIKASKLPELSIKLINKTQARTKIVMCQFILNKVKIIMKILH